MTRTRAALAALAVTIASAGCMAGSRAPDFTLRDDAAQAWRLSDQRGDAVLLTFGYTRCRDTCPAIVARLEELTGELKTGASRVEVAFVTVDPAHDSAPVLHRFLSRFATPRGSALVGLTGTTAQISSVAAAYHVYARPAAHSAVVFFIDPQGRLRGMHDDSESRQAMLSAVKELLG